MKALVIRFWKDKSGATAVEYALIAAGIALVIIVAVKNLGAALNDIFTAIEAALTK